MSGHTPGPWEIQGLATEGCSDLTIAARTPIYRNPTYVARVYGVGYVTRDPEAIARRNANARLIAEAPEMLDFIGMVARLTKEGEEAEPGTGEFVWENDDAHATLHELISVARALLARIEGQSHE